jgi:hypothetical protein
MPGQVVDTETAAEFMRETLASVATDDLALIADDLTRKAELFAVHLSPSGLAHLGRPELRSVLRRVFTARRKADAILDRVGVDCLRDEITRLLYGDDELTIRYERFQAVFADWPSVAFELPSELLHFTDPDRHWLWTRWMWDPRTDTGALALVTEDGFDFGDADPAPTYLRIGEASAFVAQTGRAAGFTSFTTGPFGIDVFLACVYTVYMYTVLRLRMTQEFNHIVPQQTELIRRLFGVLHLED